MFEFNDGARIDDFPMRDPCEFCEDDWQEKGFIICKGLQAVLRCNECREYQYMVPHIDVHAFLGRDEHER